MSNQNFKIIGDDELLKNCKITIVKTDENGVSLKKSLLFKGEVFDVVSESEIAEIYDIYVSYKDSLVNQLNFENVFRNVDDRICNLYLNKKDEQFFVKFVGREIDLKNNQGFLKPLISLKDFLNVNKIVEDSARSKVEENFFSFYK